jgi:hypothetical protein
MYAQDFLEFYRHSVICHIRLPTADEPFEKVDESIAKSK